MSRSSLYVPRHGPRKSPVINMQVCAHMQVEKGTKGSWMKVLIAMLEDAPVGRYVLKQAPSARIPKVPLSLVCSQIYICPQDSEHLPSFLYLTAQEE